MTIAPYRDTGLPASRRVDDLLSRMTLEEKIVQMSILEMKTNNLPSAGPILDEPTRKLLANGIGALGRPGRDFGPGSTAKWTNAVQKILREETRLGIPAFFIDEGLHGLMAYGCTSFPQAIGLASTWDPDLIQRIFGVVAREMRARGENYALSPVLDLAREPRWGRTEETYGEDPYLGARMGVAAVRGLQGEDRLFGEPRFGEGHVLATAKHFAVHGQPEAGTNAAPANYAEREIRETFLAAFQAAVVEARVGSVMASYNEINGIPAHVNTWLLDEVLRQEWGFEGFIISDGHGIRQLQSLHHVASSRADAARKAVEAGIDFELDTCFPTLVDQVRNGSLSEAVIDRAVRRILQAKFQLGLFDEPYADPEEAERITNNPGHRQLALEAARKSVVMLKNNGVLPLELEKGHTLAVIGPNAAGLHLGGYSNEPGHGVTILDGIRQKVGGKVNVAYAEGCRLTANDFGDQEWRRWWEDEAVPPDPALDERLIAEAVATARKSDLVLLVIGENESLCREAWSENHLGDRDSLDLPGRQNELAQALVETGVPLVVLLINGRPLSINYLAEHAAAIFEGWYLGQEGGTAFAEILLGEVNPGGRLPITFPRSVGQIPAFYNYKPSARRGYIFAGRGPLYPFGYGLSYTTFRYENLHVTPDRIRSDGETLLCVEVTNSGKYAGDEVVQLYIHDLESGRVTRPVKELKGFQRISLQPGETRTVEFAITAKQLCYLNEDMQWIVEPGVFELQVGPSSASVQSVNLEVG